MIRLPKPPVERTLGVGGKHLAASEACETRHNEGFERDGADNRPHADLIAHRCGAQKTACVIKDAYADHPMKQEPPHRPFVPEGS